ncbi:hypothetical protein PP175_27355 (plasmid) [Aneurinibacillus sp. Ricciae_BoGa-3]|uniref:hypothetical protein n=1 Tax=Aneurinibacillus sp. Ricciae_BoGa-3 TaxID=3022697 RepID=UPI002340BEDC|nr:hypothetical protein [Aneurinibacillus sp. Ricciae_BoGa-3]WCK56933.1 hypothetical protein PP175_27470 [Aneurinibacillus sp. Ricciae_BoGa-3]WCK57756.1 hypothetical protein PP175_27355 [Aneurinibacillus sp. Ricciae_BoGa-3]
MLNSSIEKKVAKITRGKEDIYVCMYVYESTLINLSFFKRVDQAFVELLKERVPHYYAQELIQRVRENQVEQVSKEELQLFLQQQDADVFRMTKGIKDVLNKTTRDMQVDYIGEVAGIYYLISKHKNASYYECYQLNKTMKEEDYGIHLLPPVYVETVLMDYLSHAKMGQPPLFLMVSENLFVGVQKTVKMENTVVISFIDVFPDSVSGSKAYLMKRMPDKNYIPLPMSQVTSETMETLQKESKQIINHFIRQMDFLR